MWRRSSRATDELAGIRRALRHDGRLVLFYETPTPERARYAFARTVDALRASGFAEPQVLSRRETLVACSAHLA
jgi:hypothetical protein